jgi:serine/threonine protein kinase
VTTVTNTRLLLNQLMGLPSAEPTSDPERLLKTAQDLLADFSLDTATFYGRYGITLSDAAANIRRVPSGGELAGLRGSALVFALAIELSARLSIEGAVPDSTELQDMTALVQSKAIMTTIKRLYELDQDGDDEAGEFARISRMLDWSTASVHRLGTTSLLLSVDAVAPSDKRFILKLVHFLFQTVEPIGNATRDYFVISEAARQHCPHVAEVYCSGAGWILQEYIAGPTLAEYVDHQLEQGQVDHLDMLRNIYVPITRAVASLHAQGRVVHADLNPSNIILQTTGHVPEGLATHPGDPPSAVVRLIDLGRNLLAGDVIGRVHSPDAHFVAPEVATLDPAERVVGFAADYYSLGLLLPLSLGLVGPRQLVDGAIPEALFDWEPGNSGLARTMADLADPRSTMRLRTLAADFPKRKANLITLADYLDDLSQALKPVEEMRKHRSTPAMVAESILVIRNPLSQLGKLATELTANELPQAGNYRFLAVWVRIARGAWLAGAIAVALSLWIRYAREAGVDFLHIPSKDLPAALGVIGISLHSEPNSVYNEACAVGLSFAGAVYQYYMNAFSMVDLRRCEPQNSFAKWADWLMRYQTLVVFPFLLLGNYVLPRGWALFSAIGMAIVAANNMLVIRRQRQVVTKLDCQLGHLTGSPRTRGYWRDLKVSEVLAEWVPTLFIYSTLVGVLAIALLTGYGHDYSIYAVIITVNNVMFFGYLEATRKGPRIAPSLVRTMVLDERWRITDSPPDQADDHELQRDLNIDQVGVGS